MLCRSAASSFKLEKFTNNAKLFFLNLSTGAFVFKMLSYSVSSGSVLSSPSALQSLPKLCLDIIILV